MSKVSPGIISTIIMTSGCGPTPDEQDGEADQALSADFIDGSGMVTGCVALASDGCQVLADPADR